MTIVPTLHRAVDDAATSRIARTLGIVEPDTARDAVGVTLSATLAVLSGMGATVPGAGAIFDTVRGERTPGALATLLGEGETESLVRAIGSHARVDARQATGLLDALGPVVLAVLAGEIERRHLDKTELSRFLRDHHAAIGEALPAGFARHVSGSRHFDTFRTGFAFDTTAPMTDTACPDPAALAEADYAETVKRPPAMRVGIAVVLATLAAAWLFYAVGAPPPDPGPPEGIERDAN